MTTLAAAHPCVILWYAIFGALVAALLVVSAAAPTVPLPIVALLPVPIAALLPVPIGALPPVPIYALLPVLIGALLYKSKWTRPFVSCLRTNARCGLTTIGVGGLNICIGGLWLGLHGVFCLCPSRPSPTSERPCSSCTR